MRKVGVKQGDNGCEVRKGETEWYRQDKVGWE